MSSCDCSGHQNVFSDRMAERDLKRYLADGPDGPTRLLVEAIRAQDVEAATLLDIGGGVGAVQFELLTAGASSAVSVDASPAFIAIARREAERRGLADRIVQREGDFVALASDVPSADVVTLVRVVCCYAVMPELVGRSATHARRMLGLVYPRDAWWSRAGARVFNLGHRLTGDGFRIHVHREVEMDRLIRVAGFERQLLRRGPLWQVALYVRRPEAPRLP